MFRGWLAIGIYRPHSYPHKQMSSRCKSRDDLKATSTEPCSRLAAVVIYLHLRARAALPSSPPWALPHEPRTAGHAARRPQQRGTSGYVGVRRNERANERTKQRTSRTFPRRITCTPIRMYNFFVYEFVPGASGHWRRVASADLPLAHIHLRNSSVVFTRLHHFGPKSILGECQRPGKHNY